MGRLARWLRVLGYDTLFHDPIDDQEMIRVGHCPACRRIDWQGTHWERMRQFLQALTLRDAPLSTQFMAPVTHGKKA